MKPPQPHKLLPDSHFENFLRRNRDLVAKTLQRLEDGTGIPQLCYETLMSLSLSNGCIAVILGHGDEEAKKHFTASVEYALKLLHAPGAPGGGMRSYEAHVELSEEGARLTSLHEKRPMAGSEKLSITDYHRALLCVVSFGDRSAFPEVAAVPEEKYRNPGTIASEDYWLYLRAWKALLRGNEAEARREAEASLSKARDQPSRATFVALLRGDAGGVAESLEAELKAHKKRFQKEPNEPQGAVCFPGLMLCRMAIDRGMKVEDGPYLPVRLLPNYKPVVH